MATDKAKARKGKSGRGKDNDDSLADGSDNSSSGGGGGEERPEAKRGKAAAEVKTRSAGRRRSLSRASKDPTARAVRMAQKEESEKAAFARRGRSGDGGDNGESGDGGDGEGGSAFEFGAGWDFGGGGDDDDDDGGELDPEDDDDEGDEGDDGDEDDDNLDFLNQGRASHNPFEVTTDKESRRRGTAAVANPRKVLMATFRRLRMRPAEWVRSEIRDPKSSYDYRAEKELRPLGYIFDALLEGDSRSALDLVAERIVTLHVAFKYRKGGKPNWDLASALEERPGDGLIPREMFASMAKHATRVQKLAGWGKPRPGKK